MNTKVIFLLLITWIVIGCKKSVGPNNSLPAATETGANTFGCKINGEVWVPYAKCDAFGDPCSQFNSSFFSLRSYSFTPITFNLSLERRIGNEFTSFVIYNLNIDQPFASVIYKAGNVFDSLDIQFKNDNGIYNSAGFYNVFSNKLSNFTITKLDSVNHIMAGNFNFILRNGTDSIVVTDGRFDLSTNGFCGCTK